MSTEPETPTKLFERGLRGLMWGLMYGGTDPLIISERPFRMIVELFETCSGRENQAMTILENLKEAKQQTTAAIVHAELGSLEPMDSAARSAVDALQRAIAEFEALDREAVEVSKRMIDIIMTGRENSMDEPTEKRIREALLLEIRGFGRLVLKS